jgi:hypothetical protein
MFVFDCYSSQMEVENALGFKWPDFRRTTIESSDGVLLVVFIQNGQVVNWYEQPRTIELGGIANATGYARSEARFRIDRESGRTRLEPIKLTTVPTVPRAPARIPADAAG